MAAAREQGQRVLADVTRAAVGRLLADGLKGMQNSQTLFNDDERQRLADQLAATNATAELLGRARIRERADSGLFSEQRTTFRQFDETSKGGPIAPMAPAEALDFFRNLVPMLNVDPKRFGPRMEREAFTLAVATDAVLLDRVKAVIEDRLGSGQDISGAPAAIQDLLDDAGVGDNGSYYAESVFRTNMMDAYNTGAQRELSEVSDSFPVWMMSNPADGRSRKKHAARNRKFWPSTILFTEVRGTDAGDVIGCRCVPIPIHWLEWAELKKAGKRLEEGTDPTEAEVAAIAPQPAPPGNAGAVKLSPAAVAQVADHFAGLLAEAEFASFDYDRLKASVEAARALSRQQLQAVADAVNAQTTAAKTKEDVLAAISNRIGAANIQVGRIGNVAAPAPADFVVPPLPELPRVEAPAPRAAKSAPVGEPTLTPPIVAAPALAPELQPYVAQLRAIGEQVETISYDEIDQLVVDTIGGLGVAELRAVAADFGGTVTSGAKGDLVRGLKVALKGRKSAAHRTGLR